MAVCRRRPSLAYIAGEMMVELPSKAQVDRLTLATGKLLSPTGINLICTALHHSLTRSFETKTVGGSEPRINELFVQVDNCTGENKNHILLGYLGSLVGRGVIDRVELTRHIFTGGHQCRRL